jgi:TolA-binding protein
MYRKEHGFGFSPHILPDLFWASGHACDSMTYTKGGFSMSKNLGNRKLSRQIGLVCTFAFLCIGFTVVPAVAEGGETKQGAASSSSKDGGLSSENLHKQITDLDGQIQKLRAQSLELQEKTRAKLQEQLDNFKQQRDTLIPRIEKLRDNSETAWQDVKDNIQKAIEDLKTSVDTMDKK